MNAFLNPWVLLGGLVSLLGTALGGYTFGHRIEKTTCERASLRVEVASQKSVLDFLQEARAQEIAAGAAVNRIAEAYEKGKTDAQATADHVVAGLNAGTLKLQSRWAGCEAKLSQATASPSKPDASALDRSESAGRAIGAAATCDAQVLGLQAYARQVSGQ